MRTHSAKAAHQKVGPGIGRGIALPTPTWENVLLCMEEPDAEAELPVGLILEIREFPCWLLAAPGREDPVPRFGAALPGCRPPLAVREDADGAALLLSVPLGEQSSALIRRGTARGSELFPAPRVRRLPDIDGQAVEVAAFFFLSATSSSFLMRSKSSLGMHISASSSSLTCSSSSKLAESPDVPFMLIVAEPPMRTGVRLKASWRDRAVSATTRSSSPIRLATALFTRSSLSTSSGSRMRDLTTGRILHSSDLTLGTRSCRRSMTGSKK
mmetsp:Transcript_14886/g.35467  ORF Transcript_14886/g.35467 Transcript_14886/m.35467 type:complete len:270 (+) Transcript_14886:580-1389(+)